MIFNFGSINVDHVYRVGSLPQPGETIASRSYDRFLGGKGVNQSIAIAKSDGDVVHIGAVGTDGKWALSEMRRLGISTNKVVELDCTTGHAIVCVGDDAENLIVIEGGANQQFEKEMVDHALAGANPETDWVLLQNETNLSDYLVEQVAGYNLKIAYAAAPFVAETTIALLPNISLLAVNELEAAALAKELNVAEEDIPVPALLITRGSKGSELFLDKNRYQQKAFAVDATDTTGAGDTFLGSFLAGFTKKAEPEPALKYAAAASALQVTRPGAALAIPASKEVHDFMKNAETS